MPGVPAVNPGAVFGSSPVTVHSLTASTEPFAGSVIVFVHVTLFVTTTVLLVFSRGKGVLWVTGAPLLIE